jgi:hypothetical protein
VQRGLARRTAEPIRYLGVDEKAITKGHRYLTIVADLVRQRVLFLNDDRETESLDTFWPTCTPAQLASIEAVAMDMWKPYVQSVSAHVPEGDAKIVFDKFVRRAKPAPMEGGEIPRKLGIRARWVKVPCGQSLTSRPQASLAW